MVFDCLPAQYSKNHGSRPASSVGRLETGEEHSTKEILIGKETKMKCSRTAQEHTNRPTVQTTAWTTTLECEVLLLSCSARRADAMETARFGQPRCDWLCGGGEDHIFTAWRLCWQKKIKKKKKDRFFLEQEKSQLSFVWIVFFA